MAKYSFLLALLFLLSRVDAQTSSNSTSQCRCMPGDACWPSSDVWADFNKTLGGKLIQTTPYPASCHDNDYGPYNESTCANIQSTFFYPEPHYEDPSSVMATFFTNGTCDPWAPRTADCTIGNYVAYSVNATGPEDYQQVINFTSTYNIRLLVKNTGHDYNGKGTGAGGVAIWTHNMKTFQLIENYVSPNFTGSAIKIGAGVQVHELYEYAHNHSLVAVGGICPTVGVAGGYTQGGGHGPLASKFGLGADNALEWEVVTGTGEYMVATPQNNSDLYWALSGGGGGTYGVVSALTVKAYPDAPTSAANLTFSMEGYEDSFWEVVEIFQERLPELVDVGGSALWYVAGTNFSIMPATGFDLPESDLEAILSPTIAKLNETGIPYTYMIQQYPTFLASYNAMDSPWNVSQDLIGGRLIPRTLVQNNASGLISAIKTINNASAVISGVCLNVSQGVPDPNSNSVNPYWRTSIYDAVIGVAFNYTDWSENQKSQDSITNYLLPTLEELTPDGGAYLNEADFQQKDYKTVFYGDHYDTLRSIKAKYDPDDIFYAITAVGSDEWYEDQGDKGRLCRVS